ncbi:MAG TPA: hypothetical protein VGD69_05125, partial [Herpetosiphonaceae bacterium]
MVKKQRVPLSVIALLLLVLPLIAACSGTPPTTPAAQSTTEAQPSTAASSAASPAAQAPDSQAVADVTVTIPYLTGGITSFDHAFWTSQLLVAQGTI